jgi:uncharacterized membrane protein
MPFLADRHSLVEAPDSERRVTANRAWYPDGGTPGSATLTIEQVGWATACLLLVLASLESSSNALTVSHAEWASIIFLLGGLVGMFYCLRTRAPSVRFHLFVLVGLGFAVFANAAGTYLANPSYGTDAVAFDQYAAQLVLHGHNPYTTSMAPALEMFHVPSNVWTLFLSGGHQHLLS